MNRNGSYPTLNQPICGVQNSLTWTIHRLSWQKNGIFYLLACTTHKKPV